MRNNKLKGKLKEYSFNYDNFSKVMGLSKTAFTNKINGKGFKDNEIAKIKKILNLTNDEVVEIFLS